jgi:hypothetical protein
MTVRPSTAISEGNAPRVAALAAMILVAATLLVAGPAALPASATGWSVANEAQYRAALIAAEADDSGPHTITITADFVIDDAGDPFYGGTRPLTIQGGGHTVTSGVAATRFLSVFGTDLTIESLEVSGFSSPVEGGYVTASGGAVLVISGDLFVDDSVFSGNSATAPSAGAAVRVHGGAVYVEYGTVIVANSAFNGNYVEATHNNASGAANAFARGGAIGVYGGSLEVILTDFENNSSAATSSSDTSYAYAFAEGGAVWGEEGSVTVVSSHFVANETHSNVTSAADFAQSKAAGAAVYAGANAPLGMEGSTFADHVIDSSASDSVTYQYSYAHGTVYASHNSGDYPSEVTDSVFRDATVTAASAGATNVGYAYAEGGAVYTYDTDLEITDVVATGATLAATSYEESGATAYVYSSGGAFASLYGSATVEGSDLSENALTGDAEGLNAQAFVRGGAVHMGDNVTILSSLVEANSVAGSATGANSSTDVSGGGAYSHAIFRSEESTFASNSAVNGGAAYAQDGAVIESSTFEANAATGDGGGVYSDQNDINVTNSTFVNNSAGSEGGALFTDSQDVYVTLSTMVANSAPSGAHVWSADHAGAFAAVFADAVGSAGCDANSVATYESTFDDDGTCSTSEEELTNDFGFGVDPMLGVLQSNGGPTKTMMPMVGSPLIDVFDVGGTCSSSDVDQRGVARPQQTQCDAGAVEVRLAPFPDVLDGHQFFTEIDWLKAEGIGGGYLDGTFRPTAGVSRQAMAAFLFRAAGEPPFVLPPSPSFTDVPLTHQFYIEIEWMASVGISTGYSDDTFRPSTPVSRQAMSAFLYRFADEPAFTAPETPSFSDVPLTSTFFDEVEWLASMGISTGYSDGTFRPSAVVSRQAMSAFLYRHTALFP